MNMQEAVYGQGQPAAPLNYKQPPKPDKFVSCNGILGEIRDKIKELSISIGDLEGRINLMLRPCVQAPEIESPKRPESGSVMTESLLETLDELSKIVAWVRTLHARCDL